MTEHPGERLSAYLDDELPAAEASAVEGHLRECEECRRRLETLAAVDRVARDLPVTAPPGYFDALPGRVRVLLEGPAAAGPRPLPSGRPRSSPLRLPAWTWAVAAVLALAVVTPLTLTRFKSPEVAIPIPTSDRRVAAPPASLAAPSPPEGERPFAARNREASKRQKEESPRAGRVGDEFEGALPGRVDSAEAQATAGPESAGLTANVAPPATDRPSAMADRMTKDAVPREVEAGKAASFAAPPPEPRSATRVPGAGYAQAQGAPAPSAPAPAEGEALKLSREEAMDEAAPEPAARARKEAAPAAAATGATGSERDDATADEYARLLPSPPPTADALRARREAWRAFALRHPEGAPADEARVRVVEMGLATWRRSGEDKDLRRAREDAAAYLRRPDAAQAARVRALVAGLPAAQ